MDTVSPQNLEKNNEIDQLINFHGATQYLNNNQLYKIYLLCPKLSNHIFINSENLFGFLSSFPGYFQQTIAQQNIFFEEDLPRHHHQFSQADTSLLVLLVPPNLIVCIDSTLLLQTDETINECIMGSYLTPDDEKFSTSVHFSMEKVRRWIGVDSAAELDTEFELPFDTDYA